MSKTVSCSEAPNAAPLREGLLVHRAPLQCALGTPASDQHVLQGMSTSEVLTVLQLCSEEAYLEAETMMQTDIYMHWKISP